jgi:hypothetical protein
MAVAGIEREIHRLGFARTCGDMDDFQFGNQAYDLLLGIHIDEDRCVHGCQILISGERAVPQGKILRVIPPVCFPVNRNRLPVPVVPFTPILPLDLADCREGVPYSRLTSR